MEEYSEIEQQHIFMLLTEPSKRHYVVYEAYPLRMPSTKTWVFHFTVDMLKRSFSTASKAKLWFQTTYPDKKLHVLDNSYFRYDRRFYSEKDLMEVIAEAE